MSTHTQYDQCPDCNKTFSYHELTADGRCVSCYNTYKEMLGGGHFVAEQKPHGILLTWTDGTEKPPKPPNPRTTDQCSKCGETFRYYQLLSNGECINCFQHK